MIDRAYGLTTDLYELTMAAAYFDNGIDHRVAFELFVRSLPKQRSYLVAAGLEQVLDYLTTMKLAGEQIDFLRSLPVFKNASRAFFDYLGELRFTGDVWAMPEGTAAFAMEPLLRVEAPVIQAQLVETCLLALVNFETSIASKAARITSAARGREIIEFGTRRAHGPEAGLLAARAAFIGGCAGTSNVEAGYLFGIPVFGTLAHSFVMLFEDEDDAFRAFLKVFPDTATILVDTYDTIAAVKRLAAADFGPGIAAIRLDSGDLLDLSKRSRKILDEAGLTNTKIFASGDLDEYQVRDLISVAAPIDAFGVGTQLATSHDAPALGGVYKLVESQIDGHVNAKMKLSPAKATYPGAKQVWRLSDSSGRYVRDVIALAGEPIQEGYDASWKPLLEQVISGGELFDKGKLAGPVQGPIGRTSEAGRDVRLRALSAARTRAIEELERLPVELLDLSSTMSYPVELSETMKSETERLRNLLRRKRD